MHAHACMQCTHCIASDVTLQLEMFSPNFTLKSQNNNLLLFILPFISLFPFSHHYVPCSTLLTNKLNFFLVFSDLFLCPKNIPSLRKIPAYNFVGIIDCKHVACLFPKPTKTCSSTSNLRANSFNKISLLISKPTSTCRTMPKLTLCKIACDVRCI